MNTSAENRSQLRAARGRLAILALVTTLWLALMAGSASAALTHKYVSSFSGGDVTAAPSGPFSGVGAEAVDNSSTASSGDVYVLDWGRGVVDQFTASGAWTGVQISGASTPAGSFAILYDSGVAVDSSATANAGDVYVADTYNGVVDRFDSSGHYLCQITGAATPSASECNGASGSATPAGSMLPAGVAVDASGDLYVADANSSVIDEFGPAGNYIGQITNSNISGPGTIALDPSGNLYVNNQFSNVVEFNPSGGFAGVIDSNSPQAVGVDPSTGHVYVDDGSDGQLGEYDSSGNRLATFGGSNVGYYVFGLAASAATGQLYSGDYSDGRVEIFSGDLVIPDITTDSASSVTQTGATLNGTVNPDGFSVTDCHFEYGTTNGYGQSVPCSQSPAQIGSGTSQVSVSADISGLSPASVYHFRLDAGNANGTSQGTDATLGTLAAAGAPTPRWQISSVSTPANFSAGDLSGPAGPAGSTVGNDAYVITATNVGDAPTTLSQITLTDNLPQRLAVAGEHLVFFVDTPSNGSNHGPQPDFGPNFCASNSPPVLCTGRAVSFDWNFSTDLCTTSPVRCVLPDSYGPIAPGQDLRLLVWVMQTDPSQPLPDGTQLTNRFTISGGGAPDASDSWTNEVSSATPQYGVERLDASLLNADGTPTVQAGGHPYALTATIDLRTKDTFRNSVAEDNSTLLTPDWTSDDPKDITLDLPPGVIGNPQATPQCPLSDFNAQHCPVDSQIGSLTTYFEGKPNQLDDVYNIAAPPGVAGEFGVRLFSGGGIVFTAGVRTGSDYGLRTIGGGLPVVDMTGLSVTIWGVPADPRHDAQRGLACDWGAPTAGSHYSCVGGGASSGAEPVPFLTNSTDCSAGALSVSASTDSWLNPGEEKTASTDLPAVTGCDALVFAPTLTVAPDTSQAGAPAGLAVDIGVPQTTSATQNGTPEVKNVTVTLPQGMTINPSGAGGLGACSDAQFAVNSPNAATCPDSSKIGTVLLHTPLLDHTLPGNVYVGAPQCSPCSPADAASGKLLRLFLQVNDPQSGVIVKLPGSVSIDQTTGQLTTSFLQNPQLPFDDLQLNLKGGPRAPLVTPDKCGSYNTTSDFTPWSAPLTLDASPSSAFDVTDGCSLGTSFAPSFTAGTQNAQAGAHSPFVLSFTRADADQQFKGLSVKLPPGLVAKTAGVPLCSDADAAAGSCPTGSQVGTVEAGAGAGSEPYFLPGKAYLTGPYKGAPYGLAVVVPAIAGPFNLGTVVVRQALDIDPTTAQVTAVSDPFPTQLDGIPLRLRRVDVNLNRPEFIVNPTSCDPMQIAGTLTSTGGMSASVANRFQVGGCAGLAFSPKLRMSLTGRGRTKSGDHPNLVSVLTQKPGQANIHNVRVALPLSLALDPNNSSHVCLYSVAQAVHGGRVGCAASTIVGHATAVTPLLSKPLTGQVYLVQGIRYSHGVQIHTLPSLLIPLRGQIALDLRAQTSVSHGKLVTTFPTIPDAAVSKFSLAINGGKKGILVITGRGRSICGSPQVTEANLIAQSGKAEYPNIKMSTPCRIRHARRHHK